MKKITIESERRYEVCIGADWRQELATSLVGRTRAALITTSTMKKYIGEITSVGTDLHIFEIPDGEAGKNVATLAKLWDWLGVAGFTRSDIVVGIGGGALTDVAGFAAASWLRGIDWIAIPTSLAGMVDASIGGKTGINCAYGKNLIGAFHSPTKVIIDTKWLETLADRDFSAGLAEVVKCGFIKDLMILDLIANKSIVEIRNNNELVIELVRRAVQVKADVVTVDFKESFAREALNYGHTLAHAIEVASDFELRHGEAVAIGMVFAAELAFAYGSLSSQAVAEHRDILCAIGLPVSYPKSAWDRLLPLISLDKKVRGNSIRFVILQGLGKTERFENVSIEQLAAAYEKISS